MFDQHSFVIGKKYLFERKEGGMAAVAFQGNMQINQI
jgi:hypothetical protein